MFRFRVISLLVPMISPLQTLEGEKSVGDSIAFACTV